MSAVFLPVYLLAGLSVGRLSLRNAKTSMFAEFRIIMLNFRMNPAIQQDEKSGLKGFGLTCCVLIGINALSSHKRSAANGFPCSKPLLNPIKRLLPIQWRLFIESSPEKQQLFNRPVYYFF